MHLSLSVPRQLLRKYKTLKSKLTSKVCYLMRNKSINMQNFNEKRFHTFNTYVICRAPGKANLIVNKQTVLIIIN